ncbi:response regulator [Pedobacter sp. MW01-1-1]|uniref:response regulator n=1 Tax=Pedobacter sp. MW01-1-1 TaxID=3383027 RepID=UPI003FEE4909
MNISIIEDHKLLSSLLRMSLKNVDSINGIEIYSEAEQFFNEIETKQTDLLITDILLPDLNGLEVIRRVRSIKTSEALKILVLSSVDDVIVINAALRAGANGYLFKGVRRAELLKAIQFVAEENKRKYISASLKDVLRESKKVETTKFELSNRQMLVLKELCNGKNVKEIAQNFDLSVHTIQGYVKQIMRKMGVSRLPDLILKALQYKLVEVGIEEL